MLEINREAFAAAIAPLTQARETFAANSYRRGVALQEYMLGRALTGMGDHARAIARLRGAEALVYRDADPVTHGRVLRRLGEAHRAAGRLNDAALVLGKALEVMSAANAPFYVATALEVLAGVRGEQGARDLQRRELNAALTVFAAMGSPRAAVIEDHLAAPGA